jgi:hypothetical protein
MGVARIDGCLINVEGDENNFTISGYQAKKFLGKLDAWDTHYELLPGSTDANPKFLVTRSDLVSSKCPDESAPLADRLAEHLREMSRTVPRG